ncbi:hypothetical protein FXV83_21520 [Bradyrhizobium hipponense]|uniref:Uncharacterized protein n=1 Tax=Bradyrhizobium hipponense TaxID=2605638 RepID=A0A5S4YLL3_9BRAD|nr:hypothetical protein [Bradyrhizobium hipponense]TYO64514.1 hypothetical protein FXV83_21520 [Bradyrhizobium hipponense]
MDLDEVVVDLAALDVRLDVGQIVADLYSRNTSLGLISVALLERRTAETAIEILAFQDVGKRANRFQHGQTTVPDNPCLLQTYSPQRTGQSRDCALSSMKNDATGTRFEDAVDRTIAAFAALGS